jgi:lysophospholipase L1-like esterase
MTSEKHSSACRFLTGAIAAIAAAALVATSAASIAQAQAGGSPRWIGTWSTGLLAALPPPPSSPAPAASAPFPSPPRVANQTLRQIVRVSAGGTRVRVALTNRFGTRPLRIDAAHVARRAKDSALDGSGAPLTFGGRPSVTIEAGSLVLSDPAPVPVRPLSDVVVDLFLPDDIWAAGSPATYHASALTTSYLSKTGNHAGVARLPVESTFQQWLFLARVEVSTSTASGAVATMGDSITDGTGSTPDANDRWPDFLAERLAARYGAGAPAVLNVGIAGNRVLSHNAGLNVLRRAGLEVPGGDQLSDPNALFGPSALSRFDHDVLLQPGVTHVVVLEGINDIGMAFDAVSPTAEELIAGHRTLIQRAHARGLRIYGATLTPFDGAFYWREAGEAKRRRLNEWIRTSGEYDAVIDFDAAVRDPKEPTKFQAAYHPGDWLHGSDAGYKAMAGAIDIALFAPGRKAASAGTYTGAKR